MNRMVEFFRLAQQHRMRLSDLRGSETEVLRAASYINSVCELAKALEIEDFSVARVDGDPSSIGRDSVLGKLYQVDDFLNAVYAAHIFDLDGELAQKFVSLDEDWRDKASSYIAHIRKVVQNADVEERLREAILKRLNDLQREIGRNRAKLDAVVDALLVVTEAVGKGAKNLEPAVKLLEKLAGALSGLRRSEQDAKPQLPPPDALGLPDLTESDESDSD
ncbi:hypothetical protein V6C03_06045 [Methyloligella sp. 2.7D]|uniref:hypothetical protein n=1 Tax=unclassified Methyloligella TaxID=2625955 RepID=UPI00157C897D|nr:hypothetical protein [Methyloligella sp. GL2]QKP78525.1 hypothetical protein HT051_14410 [Methyloligella sp. GL2]